MVPHQDRGLCRPYFLSRRAETECHHLVSSDVTEFMLGIDWLSEQNVIGSLVRAN